MKKTTIFVLAVLVIMTSLSVHVVVTEERGVEVVFKDHLSLQATYVDARHAGLLELATMPGAVRAYLIRDVHYPALRKQIREKAENVKRQLRELVREGGQQLRHVEEILLALLAEGS